MPTDPMHVSSEEFAFDTYGELVARFPEVDASVVQAAPAWLMEGMCFAGFRVRKRTWGFGLMDQRKTAEVSAIWRPLDGSPGGYERVIFDPGGMVADWPSMAALAKDLGAWPPYELGAAQNALQIAAHMATHVTASLDRLPLILEAYPALNEWSADMLRVVSNAFHAGRYMREAELVERFELDIEAKESFTEARRNGGKEAARRLKKRTDDAWRASAEKIIRDERVKDRNVPEDAIVASVREKLGQGKSEWPSAGSILALKRKIVALDRTLESDRERQHREKRQAK